MQTHINNLNELYKGYITEQEYYQNIPTITRFISEHVCFLIFLAAALIILITHILLKTLPIDLNSEYPTMKSLSKKEKNRTIIAIITCIGIIFTTSFITNLALQQKQKLPTENTKKFDNAIKNTPENIEYVLNQKQNKLELYTITNKEINSEAFATIDLIKAKYSAKNAYGVRYQALISSVQSKFQEIDMTKSNIHKNESDELSIEFIKNNKICKFETKTSKNNNIEVIIN